MDDEGLVNVGPLLVAVEGFEESGPEPEACCRVKPPPKDPLPEPLPPTCVLKLPATLLALPAPPPVPMPVPLPKPITLSRPDGVCAATALAKNTMHAAVDTASFIFISFSFLRLSLDYMKDNSCCHSET